VISPNPDKMRRPAFGIAAVAVAVVVAACGAASSTVTHTVTQAVTQTVTVTDTTTVTISTATSTSTSSTTTPSTSTTPTTSTSTTTSTAASAGGSTTACTAADLTPVFLGSDGATGRVVLAFALRNKGTAACHTYGWPGVQFAAAGGSPIPTTTTRTTNDLLGSTPAAALTLGAGQEASFRIIVPDSKNGSNVGCSTAGEVRIIAPDDTASMVATLTAPVTVCGTATLSPLLSGTDAAPSV
jgi:hypothetical protein